MSSRVSAFVIWALVSATVVFWGMRQFVRGPSAPTYTVPIGDSTVVRGDLTRLLGAMPVAPVAAGTPPPEISTRFHLVGVMAPRANGPGAGGVAVIAIDGKPPRAFRVGATLDADLMLRSVALRTAEIGTAKGTRMFTLELPARVAAATGTLPNVSMYAPDGVPNAAPGGVPPLGAMPVPPPGFPTAPPDAEPQPVDAPPPLDQNGQPMR